VLSMRYWFLWASLIHPHAWQKTKLPSHWVDYFESIQVYRLKKRIIVVQPQTFFVKGGAESLSTDIILALRQSGYDADLCTLPFLSFGPKFLAMFFEFFLWHFLKLRDMNARPVDIVIATKFPAYYVNHPNKLVWLAHQSRSVYDLKGTKYTTIRNNFIGNLKQYIVRHIDNRAFTQAKKVFTISQNVAKRLKQFNNIEAEVLYPPLRNREIFYTDNYGDYVFYCGRLHPAKRIDLAIMALARCKTSVRLLIAGDGDPITVNRLKKLVLNNELSKKVEFKGYVTNQERAKLYANCLAALLPLYDEDYGYVTLEAFQSKKPVIACNDSGGLLEFLHHNQNGYICEPKADKLADKIDYLYDNREIAKQFGENGYQAIQHLSWSVAIKKLIEHIER